MTTPTTLSTTPLSAPAPPPGSPDAGFLQEWQHVRIDQVELQAPAAQGALAIVRACVHLGALLPPDACVELTFDTEPGAPARRAERMWTARGYDNGDFLFETHLPAGALASGKMHVCVRPADGTPWRAAATPVSYLADVPRPGA